MLPPPVRLGIWLPAAALVAVFLALAWGDHGLRTPWGREDDAFRDISLMAPDPRVSAAKAILLRSQYRYFLRFQHVGPAAPARRNAARKYNLFTTECSPDVFLKTHLPRSVQ